jgi:hypothetical protein
MQAGAVSRLELLLFTTDADQVREASAAGIAGFVVDWERRGKRERQRGFDTQINDGDAADLRRVRGSTRARVLCRINGVHESTAEEVDLALACGADEILVPMVRRPSEAEGVLELVKERASVGMLVETHDALGHLAELARLPLSRVYLGLNDLSIERRTSNLFEPVVDGTLERVREAFALPFGFAGLTLPDRGRPVPCRLLIGEMARIGCRFGVLRRSFLRDVPAGSMAMAVERILAAFDDARRRTPARAHDDRRELERVVKEIGGGAFVQP